MDTATNAKDAARILTAHHRQFCAGFYPSTGGRAFLARAKGDTLEISPDFKTWETVAAGTHFSSSHGRAFLKFSPVA